MTRPIPPGPLEHDSEGDPLPQPAPNSDLADLIQLLEYARTKDFQIGPLVRVGRIQMQVRDVRQARKIRDLTGKEQEPERETSIWQEHGFDDGSGDGG